MIAFCVIWPLIHADGPSKSLPLSNQRGLRRGFRTGVRVGAVVVSHGLYVAPTPHATAGDFASTVDGSAAAVSSSPVFWRHLQHIYTVSPNKKEAIWRMQHRLVEEKSPTMCGRHMEELVRLSL